MPKFQVCSSADFFLCLKDLLFYIRVYLNPPVKESPQQGYLRWFFTKEMIFLVKMAILEG